ncbi:restriction endonuclease [Mucilaginibacter sp. BJC16-A38]|uniref:restriction endonuclease n=1 Tax=Mucilaginibacter phenanthrenivorans TaxID=1234842 RepID=UPI002157014D|nr:restriction endonuclease [Mucilaginibacter phenanthrenivorans]MCR8560301.1 restriction endonuclease [Mucilaginibacter phenanthrenivorans]
MSIKPTQTTNRPPFSVLDPSRFEDICFMLLEAMYNWHELIHIGRTGSDGGVDIKGTKLLPGGRKETWLVQCKRHAKVSQGDLKSMVDKIIVSQPMPDYILLIVSCDLTKAKYEYINNYYQELGVPELIIWTATSLEAFLYAHPKVKAVAFGDDSGKEKQTKTNAQEIIRGLKMKDKLLKAILNHKALNNPANRDKIFNDPSLKFISEDVYIRSVDDRTYPNMPERQNAKISPWFRSFFHDTYHNGIELHLSAAIGADIIMNKDGYWEPIRSSDDERLKSPLYRVVPVKCIGRIPYSGIAAFITDGDEMTSCPHLFCLFDHDGMPYEEIYYKFQGNKNNGFIEWDVDRSKQTVFPKIK